MAVDASCQLVAQENQGKTAVEIAPPASDLSRKPTVDRRILNVNFMQQRWHLSEQPTKPCSYVLIGRFVAHEPSFDGVSINCRMPVPAFIVYELVLLESI